MSTLRITTVNESRNQCAISDILNPMPLSIEPRCQLLSPESNFISSESPTPIISNKKQKVAKDGASFIKTKPKGELRYKPCEEQPGDLAAEHNAFQVRPMGSITEYSRHIPYTSEKKTFVGKTGRQSFEVFQYVFTKPGETKEHLVLWDYNVGLVRMTPFFKCRGLPKTAPAKMLNCNPGLRDITHSITGGSLAAQGYWMPFEAAKAMAATFCWDIRYALTPIFGLGFPRQCLRQEDPDFGRMIIDHQIIERCSNLARRYRDLSGSFSGTGSPKSMPSPQTTTKRGTRMLCPKALKALDLQDGCGSDSDHSASYVAELGSPRDADWTAVNTPRSMEPLCFPPNSPTLIGSTLEQQTSTSATADSCDSSIDVDVAPEAFEDHQKPLRRYQDDQDHAAQRGSAHEKRQREDSWDAKVEAARILLNLRYGPDVPAALSAADLVARSPA